MTLFALSIRFAKVVRIGIVPLLLWMVAGCVPIAIPPTMVTPSVPVRAVPTYTPTALAEQSTSGETTPGAESTEDATAITETTAVTETTMVTETTAITETTVVAVEVPATAQPAGLVPPVTVGLDASLSEHYSSELFPLLMRFESLETSAGLRPVQVMDRGGNADVTLTLVPLAQAGGQPILERFYAPVVPFATVNDAIALSELAARWRGDVGPALVVPTEHRAEVRAILGAEAGPTVLFVSLAELLPTVEANPGSVGIVPFDALHPRYKVLAVDGVNVLDNRLDVAAYPLAVALVAQGNEATALVNALAPSISDPTNRHADRLTALMMTGVTAMSRVTALRMDQKGYTYPAMIISDTLRAADITHISNEVPFLDDCVTNPGENVLILCSKLEYWATLEAVGTDIVGLSGNHVNDFGRDGADALDWVVSRE